MFLSDDVDNESIGKLTWSILQQIQEDDEKDEKEKDYKRNLGKEVEIRTYRMVDKKKEFTGLLDSYDYEAGTVTIELEDGTMKTFEKGDIALIRLAFDF